MTTTKTSFALAAGTLLLGAVLPCGAADEVSTEKPDSANLPWEKGSVSLGGFLTAFDSTLTFGANNLGVTINGEDLLNLDSELTVLRVGGLYRPGKSLRHQLDFSYAAYHRSGRATIDREITVGDVTLPVGADVETVFNFDIYRATYSYAMLQDERMRLALGLGVYAIPLRYSLKAETTGGRMAVEAADTTLPLPVLTLRGDFLLRPKLYLSAGVDAMYLEISDFKGSIVDFNIALEYRPWKHLGLGVGYNAFSANIEGEDMDSDYPGVNFIGEVGIDYSGLMLYGKFLF